MLSGFRVQCSGFRRPYFSNHLSYHTLNRSDENIGNNKLRMSCKQSGKS